MTTKIERSTDTPEPNRAGDLRIWWIVNPPREAERYPVKNIHEAIAKLDELAKRDLALGDKVYANAGGLEELDEDGGRNIDQIEQTLVEGQ